MKSRFYLAFILAGIAPIVGLAGFYLYTEINGVLSAPKAPPVAASAPVNLQQEQSEVQTIASSLFNAIRNTNTDAANLTTRNGSVDLQNFINTHTGISGIVVVNAAGKADRTVPASAVLIDSQYSSNPEFGKIISKFKETNRSKNYQFYTNRLGYPAFVFAVPLVKGSFAEVILNVANFFKGIGSGQYFILDANSGQFLYHSDPSQLKTNFNLQHEAWLNKVQADLSAQKSGISPNGTTSAAAYGYLGFGTFGVVHIFPLVPAAPPAPLSASNDLSESVITPMSLGFVLALALLCIGAGVASRILAAPFRRAVDVILAAGEDNTTLTPEIVKSFGGDEAGQIVQAMALYNEKVQQNKNIAVQNLSDQLISAQRRNQQHQNEAQEKTQQLNDKLKELEALKGMTEGLRNQNEQTKTEISRLKSDAVSAQTQQSELDNLQTKNAQLQAQLKIAETKALQVASAATPIQVSQVRAAAIRTMSEELKSTLAIIKGYVSSVIGAGQGGINEKQQEFLGMVINRSARLEKFINDLVDIYQVEIEQKDAKTEEVNLASEIETFAFNFQTQTELKNLKFKVEAKPGLPKVPVVRRRMIQLWNVLYLQLIKDSPKGSTIPIVVEPSGDSVKVTVQDPGLIVAPEALPRLFDEFYDPKHPASPQLAGTGLKLALVKTILTAHGGTAVAEKADPGTRLIFTFATKAKPASIPATTVLETKTVTPAPTPVSSSTAVKSPTSAGVDLNSTFGVKPPVSSPAGTPALSGIPPVTNIPGAAKPPLPSGTAPSASLPPIPGLTVGAKPPQGSSLPVTPLPPMAGLSVGSKPPAGDGPSGSALPPLPPIPGLTVGAKPPSVGSASVSTPSVPAAAPVPGMAPKPMTSNILDALISGNIPSVTAPGLKPAGAPPAAPTPGSMPTPPLPAAGSLPTVPIPKPSAPIPPPTAGMPNAPKPALSGSLEDLLNMKPSAPPKPSEEDDVLE